MARRAEETEMRPRRFWQAKRELASVIWDAKRNRELVKFTRGTATVTDPAIAELLISQGYIEVPMDDVERPVPYIDVATLHGLSMSAVQPGVTARDVGILDGGFSGHDSHPSNIAIEV